MFTACFHSLKLTNSLSGSHKVYTLFNLLHSSLRVYVRISMNIRVFLLRLFSTCVLATNYSLIFEEDIQDDKLIALQLIAVKIFAF